MDTIQFKDIYNYLTEEERNIDFGNSLAGTHEYQNGELVVFMGIESIKRVQDFQNKMIEKYKHNLTDLDIQKINRPRGSNYTKPKKKRK